MQSVSRRPHSFSLSPLVHLWHTFWGKDLYWKIRLYCWMDFILDLYIIIFPESDSFSLKWLSTNIAAEGTLCIIFQSIQLWKGKIKRNYCRRPICCLKVVSLNPSVVIFNLHGSTGSNEHALTFSSALSPTVNWSRRSVISSMLSWQWQPAFHVCIVMARVTTSRWWYHPVSAHKICHWRE